ncbi:MAG: DUF4382 domain-containing protein [Candidatus Micrarchaeota archaeon]
MRALFSLGLLIAVLLSGCYGPAPQAPEGKGRAVFAIADAAADMGAVSSIEVTVDEVSVHSASEGWVTVSSTPKTYDLMELRASGERELLADAQLDSGEYQQMRLRISKVLVTDGNGTHEARMPSKELKIAGAFSVGANATSTATFDFAADESLHVTGEGQYVLAPVVGVETRRDAEVTVESDARVVIRGGNVLTSTRVGMDENGTLGVGLKIPAGAAVSIQDGVITVMPPGLNASGKGNIVVGITDAAANLSSVSGVEVTVDSVSIQSASGAWVVLSDEGQTFDLLELRDEDYTALLADADVGPGSYNQLRLEISNVVVTDESGEHEARMPSGELKVIGDLDVGAGSASTAVFDFMANESLHVTGNGTYIFAPVVRLETRDGASVEVGSGGRVGVTGGRTGTNVTVGMDERGRVGAGLRIPANAAVSISADGTIVVTPKIPSGGNGTIIDVGGSIGVQ